jgi:hypothetical protein
MFIIKTSKKSKLFFINIIRVAAKETVLDWRLNNIIIFITP